MTVIFTIRALTNGTLQVAHSHVSPSEGDSSATESYTCAYILSNSL